MSRHDRESVASPDIGPGYAVFQLSRALLASPQDNPAPARERIERWQRVVQHLMRGSADYGSRTPLADVPAWVTLEVATGGFATGRLLAGGTLTDEERRLADSVPCSRPGFERLDLNAWHLTDCGIQSLQERLVSGHYRIDVPEEAALLTVAWLLGQQRMEAARALIEVIAPFFGQLRFFPMASEAVSPVATQVQLCDVGEVRQQLANLAPQPRLAVQKEVVTTQLPFYDAAIALFLMTYEHDWPCRHYPDGWFEHATLLCDSFDAAWGVHNPLKERVGELYVLLRQCVCDPKTLTGRQVGRIRQIVNEFMHKHGHPESETHRQHRLNQSAHVAAPEHHLIAKVVSGRLVSHSDSEGITDFSALLLPLSDEEAKVFGVREGVAIPAAVRRRLERCRQGTIAELIDKGLIRSADTVAQLLPAMTAEICSAGFRDDALRRLSIATYRAFRRRRSLLLLNLQSQVKLGELPWVAAVAGDRENSAIEAEGAKQVLTEAVVTALTAFPHAILPNKLLQEFRALTTTAKLKFPLIEEVAADIFMGAFSGRYVDAARRAAWSMAGTLYARYYDIDTDRVVVLPDPPQSHAGRDQFAIHCAQRAHFVEGRFSVAANGTVIEQQQILTTQNLCVLFDELGLKAQLREGLGLMARQCFQWICRRQQVKTELYHSWLVTLKNTAYAWRQMVFYLSLLDEHEMRDALDNIEAHFARQPATFQERLLPAMIGLRLAADGERLTLRHQQTSGARVFLGWTVERHWLMPSKD